MDSVENILQFNLSYTCLINVMKIQIYIYVYILYQFFVICQKLLMLLIMTSLWKVWFLWYMWNCKKKWIVNYLSNRKQYVDLENNKSSMQKTECGVPQGSTFGVTTVSNICQWYSKLYTWKYYLLCWWHVHIFI